MAISACAHCQNQSFELHEPKVSGAKHRLFFVQCTACGAPAGILEGQAAAALQEQAVRLKDIEHQMTALADSVTHIRHIVGALAKQRAY